MVSRVPQNGFISPPGWLRPPAPEGGGGLVASGSADTSRPAPGFRKLIGKSVNPKGSPR